jgi:hypothetical protein
VEGDRRGRREARSESHRARLPQPERARGPSARERLRCGVCPLCVFGFDRAAAILRERRAHCRL